MTGQNAAAQQQAQKPVAQPVKAQDRMSRGGYFGANNSSGTGNAGLLNTASTQRNTFLGI